MSGVKRAGGKDCSMTAGLQARQGMRPRLGRRQQREDKGASHWPSLLLRTRFQPPCIRSFDCRGTCYLSQSFAIWPPEDAGPAPSPHHSAPRLAESHLPRRVPSQREVESEGSPWLHGGGGCTSFPPQQLFALPPSSPSFLS